MTQRFVTSALVAAVALAGCSKKDKDKAPPADPGSGSAMTNTPPPPPPPAVDAPAAGSGSAAPAAAGDQVTPPTGTPIKLRALNKFALTLPKPAKAPATGTWATDDHDGEGRKQVTYKDGDKSYYVLQFLDCRIPDVQAEIGKPMNEHGDFAWCFMKPTDKLKDYDHYVLKGGNRAIKVGNLIVVSGKWADQKDITDEDVDAFLLSLDLPTLAGL